ncbi:MAG: BamA/TamA family outer membrane protein [Acidobacteria bacterium]|nr:BamA/TamA family outer membrane protein [Acidobacteriota bacterium]
MGARRTGTGLHWRRGLKLAVFGLVGTLAGLGALGLLVVAGGALALRSPRVQRSVIEGFSESVGARFGVSMAAEGFDLGLLGGRLEVRRLELRAGDGEPFARIERVRVHFRPMTFLRGPIRLELLEFERPEVNLDAPFPIADPADQGDQDTLALESFALTIDRLRVVHGQVMGSAPPRAREVLEDWQLTNVEVEARFDGRRLTVTALTTDARIGRGAAPSIELRVEAAAGLELSGAADIEKFLVTGQELSVDATLRLGGGWNETSGAFRIETDAGYWLGAKPTGRVKLEGQFDLAAWKGSIHLVAPAQPGSLLTDLDLVASDLGAALELEKTAFDLRLELDLEKNARDRKSVIGELSLVVVRDSRAVLELDARPRLALGGKSLDDLKVEVAAELRLLPGEAGVRTATVRLSSEQPKRLEAWRIERGKAVIEQPSIERLLAVVSSLWPKLLVPSSIRDLPSFGTLSASADFGGALDDPWVEASARVSPDAKGRIELTAKGRPLSSDWSLDAAGVDLELGHFTPVASGRIDFTGKIEDLLGTASGSLEVAAREIATESGTLFSALDLALQGSLEKIDWRVEGIVDGVGGASGGLRGQGTLRPELFLGSVSESATGSGSRSAAGTLTWETGDDRLPRVEGSFELSRGTLSVSVTAPTGAETAVEAQLELPLGALDALAEMPGLGELVALTDWAALPGERSRGPVILAWQVPVGEWRDFFTAELSELSEFSEPWQERLGRVVGGSNGRLSLDLACLTCSTGSAELHDLAVELDGRRLQAMNALRFRIAEGRVSVEPWTVTGDGFELEMAGEVRLSSGWRPGDPARDVVATGRGTISADLDSFWLESLPVEILSPGTIQVRAEASGPLDALTGFGSFAAPGLKLSLDAYPAIVMAGAAVELSLSEGVVEWQDATLAVNGAELRSEGRALLGDPLAATSGSLRLASGLPVVTAATLPFEITDGWLSIDEGLLTTAGGDGTVRLAVPLDGRSGATGAAEWNLPVNDWAPLLARFRGWEDPETLEFASRGSVTLPFDQPAAAESEIHLTAGRIVVRGRETVIEPGIEISLREGVLQVIPFRLRTAEQNFRLEASADLERGWGLADGPADLIERFELVGRGEVDSGLLNPFLAGGRAEGGLHLDFEIHGTPSAFSGHMRVDGPSASFLYRSPYLARFEEPSLEISIQDGRVALDRASLRLNEGTLEVSGVLSEEGRTDLGVRIADSVFRLDHGLIVTMAGDLRYQLGRDGASAVSGIVNVERGALTRSVQLDLDLLSQILAPIDLTTTEDDPLDLIALKLEVRTREGVRVKNNLGDLLVRWEPLEITGTLARPIIEGRLEVDPGGLLYLYGQTVRLDKAVIEYSGQDGAEPRLDFEATTSLEDPTIGRLVGADPFKAVSREEPGSASATEGFKGDLARYYGEQLAGRVGESVGVTVSLRPLLIFGETDPGTRLTVSRDLSPNLALAASIGLRGAEDRTYLLEIHELRTLSRLVGQAFTDDRSGYGGALLQRQQWGGSHPVADGELPRISKIVSTPPKGVSRRGIKRALAVQRGDFFDARQRFVAEVELVDYLMHKGYPDARISVRAVPDERRERRVRLEVDIQPGPLVEFVFEGEKIAKPLRALIRSLYRPDFFEPESIEEMRTETVRALRSRGFLEPRVAIAVEQLGREVGVRDRRITVRTEGGIRISPAPPIFPGLPPEEVEVLNAAFANSVQRVELAVGLPSADRRLLSTLAAIGYPEARIVKRYQSLGAQILTVEVEAGPRQHIASVSIEGVGEGAGEGAGAGRLSETAEIPEIPKDEIKAQLLVAPGDPLRRSRLSRSAIAIERYLGSKGYLQARVRAVLEPEAVDDPYSIRVRYVVEPGKLSGLEAVEFRGLRSTRERFSRRVAGLEIGKPLARDDLSRARTALWRTGLFSGVGAEIIESEAGLDRVVFDLEERDRYRLTYGVRWDSEDGVGAVVEATDDNFLGRGWTLGLRALASSEEDSLRGLARVPRAFGGPGSLELFAAVRKLTELSTDVIFGQVEVPVDVFESTLQYSHPVTERTTLRIYGRYTDTTRQLPFFTLQIKNPQLGFQYLYDSRSPEPLTERGVFASVDLSGSKEFLGGDLSYVRTFSQLSLFRPAGRLFGSRLLWSQSYRVGLAESFDQELIRDVRFFAGGEYSVRGYETESLGEQAQFGSIGEAVGGSALLVINQELRWRLFDDYTLVLFADTGNVWRDIGDFGSNLFPSGGLGLRAVTPVGLLRLDVAHPLRRRHGIDPEYKIYFGLGTTF